MTAGVPGKAAEFAQVRQRGLHAHLVQTLGQAIVAGEVAPGDALPIEDELCAQFGVSKTVVREAIRVLADKGLVTTRPRLGTRVQPREHWRSLDVDILAWQRLAGSNEQFLRDLEECRAIVEPAACRLAAERASEEEIADLLAALDRMAASVRTPEAFFDADVEFHESLLKMSHNLLLRAMSSAITNALHARHDTVAELLDDMGGSLPEHRRVARAIADRQPKEAEEAMVTLLQRAAEDDRRVEREGG